MFGYDRSRALAGAQAILDQRGWCVLEVCVDIAAQSWEARVVMFGLVAEAVADQVVTEVACEPEHDARLTGCDRRTLEPSSAMGSYLCYVVEAPAQSGSTV
jgi:hypothetical protein